MIHRTKSENIMKLHNPKSTMGPKIGPNISKNHKTIVPVMVAEMMV
eukprot:CAMPEP_0178925054 /NCGR_PEP_ID=MMETSP0786-20121207/17682_1 /TAXON_ID=186022 /ORGANISM="Thalassionema frauenfeldii, Strain CCMP 1798" /LENGTH=45 /DNA_ID= /DNA_START= /DNA_END= /DNA_ORIENTATION=